MPACRRRNTGCHAVCYPLAGCHFASDRDNVSELNLSGYPRFSSRGVFSCQPASRLECLVCLKNCDETHQTFQPGRQALVSHGQHSLAALAVGGQRALLSSRHVAGVVVACVRPAGGVSSSVAVVAAVRVQLPVRHRLVAAVSSRAASRSRFAAQSQNSSLRDSTRRTFAIAHGRLFCLRGYQVNTNCI